MRPARIDCSSSSSSLKRSCLGRVAASSSSMHLAATGARHRENNEDYRKKNKNKQHATAAREAHTTTERLSGNMQLQV
jgi:hypothetical protein